MLLRTVFAVTLAVCHGGCTTAPLVSSRGVSGTAAGELGGQALFATIASIFALGKQGPPSSLGDHLGVPGSEVRTVYLGGIIPVNRDERVDNGTRIRVDGRKRGFLPLVMKLRKPGPHVVTLGIPAWKPYEFTLHTPVRLGTAQGPVEAWPPIIVDCLSGEIFTTKEAATIDPDRNSGSLQRTSLANTSSSHALLIVTTTSKQYPGWRKIGQMRPAR